MPTTPPDDADNILSRIEDEARAVAASFGVPTPNDLAAALLDRLRVNLGGERIYVPQRDRRTRASRDAAIRAEFTGNNHADLARRHQISIRQVRNVLRRAEPK